MDLGAPLLVYCSRRITSRAFFTGHLWPYIYIYPQRPLEAFPSGLSCPPVTSVAQEQHLTTVEPWTGSAQRSHGVQNRSSYPTPVFPGGFLCGRQCGTIKNLRWSPETGVYSLPKWAPQLEMSGHISRAGGNRTLSRGRGRFSPKRIPVHPYVISPESHNIAIQDTSSSTEPAQASIHGHYLRSQPHPLALGPQADASWHCGYNRIPVNVLSPMGPMGPQWKPHDGNPN